MTRPVRGHSTVRLQPEGKDKPETSHSVPEQEGQVDATSGKSEADYNLDVDYKSRDQTKTSKQLMRKRKTLMQSMQKLSYLKLRHCIRRQ